MFTNLLNRSVIASFRRCMLAFLLFTATSRLQAQENTSAEQTVSPETKIQQRTPTIALAIHGGAGTIDREKMTPEAEKQYRAGLENALKAGYDILQRGGSSLDAVEAAVRVLEDDPHFNAGKGAVFTSEGVNELDAAIMEGKTLKAGAVASVRRIRNPISLARLVMEKSPHVTLDCAGAEAFAKEQGIELVDPKYFFTQERWDALQRVQAAKKQGGGAGGKQFFISDQDCHGTVGAVALDRNGNLAAATSTGGTTNKRPGRIGDSPVIGAGTYANNATCAVSGTGDGEYFIRAVVGHEISALMEYRGLALEAAADAALKKVEKLGGTGGVIAIDRNGHVAMPFNTSGMYRGRVDPKGNFIIEIYR
jgi:beta-aspartyl-peptidase (threonine type)